MLIIRRSKVYYTASGIVTPVGVYKARFCALSWLTAKIIVKLVYPLIRLNVKVNLKGVLKKGDS